MATAGTATPAVALVASQTALATGVGTATAAGAAAAGVGATAAGVAGGAIVGAAGAAATGTCVATGAAIGAAAAATEAVGAAAVAGATAAASGSAYVAGASTLALVSGPVGWLVAGVDLSENRSAPTFHCFRAILHEEPAPDDKGRTIRELACDPRVKLCEANFIDEASTLLGSFTIVNTWDEEFSLFPLRLPDGSIAFHAEPDRE